MQFYYFWKKLCVDYKCTQLDDEEIVPDEASVQQVTTPTTTTNLQEHRPHVCEMPDCSAVCLLT